MPPIILQRPGSHPRGGTRPSPGTPEYEALTELLKEGRKAIAKGEPEEAMAIFGSALSIDGRNEEARRGMQEAARMMRVQMRKKWGMPDEVGPVPPVPPAAPAPRAQPQPRPSPDGPP